MDSDFYFIEKDGHIGKKISYFNFWNNSFDLKYI